MEQNNVFVIDIEADNLLDDVTKIHCLCYYNVNTQQSGSITDYDEMRNFVLQDNLTLICHNAIRYDKPVLEKILDIIITAKIIDTLALSWYLYPMRSKHGLEWWGEDFGVPKPKIDDWENLSVEEYIYRCEEDVKINTKLYNKEIDYLNEIYQDQGIDSIIGYLMFKMDCAREQEEVRWKLDVEQCTKNLEYLESEKESKRQALVDIMPKNTVYKKKSKPKNPYKKDGTYSHYGESWFALLEEMGLPEDHEEPIEIVDKVEVGNPNSSEQLKSWLFDLGWKPQTFKYDKEDDGSLRKIPQINLPFGQGICDSIKDLFEQEPALENLDNYSVLSHRIGILKGFLRDQKNGYLQAKINGFTNTLRCKHTELVNLPGVAQKYGEYIRSVLIAEDNYTLCGSDLSSLEDRGKQHYMYFFDPEYVESMIKPGFDPHLDLAEFAYNLTNGKMGVSSEDVEFYKNFTDGNDKAKYKEVKKSRHLFKTVNYSAIYGVGAFKMSLSSGMSQQDCKTLIHAYWEKNWSVKKVSESTKIQHINDQMWQRNPVNGFWYSLRYKKDIFSTLNQGLGSYIFDLWVKKCRDKGVKMCGQFHDEHISQVFNAAFDKEQREKILRDSIEELNQELNLNREMDIDVQFGNTYAEIH